VYTGSDANNTAYPVGTNLLVYGNGSAITRNDSNAIEFDTALSQFFCWSGGTGTALSGTWRARGGYPVGSVYVTIFERTA